MSNCKTMIEIGRRQFLRGGGVAAAAAGAALMAP
ncbi:MAG: twin-arginine translocation signal domain-containing protein, partial [Rhodospirillaceae bacterium]|nr:twin-arginine translocation signal domain-containing protein [Rhodospirillales bacterium]